MSAPLVQYCANISPASLGMAGIFLHLCMLFNHFKWIFPLAAFFFQQHIPWPPMPPAPAPVSSSSGTAENEDALASMLMSWYLTGYHTGYYQVKQNSESLVEDSYWVFINWFLLDLPEFVNCTKKRFFWNYGSYRYLVENNLSKNKSNFFILNSLIYHCKNLESECYR